MATLHVRLSNKASPKDSVSFKKVSVREKLLAFLLGKKQKLTILVPGDEIDKLMIVKENKEN